LEGKTRLMINPLRFIHITDTHIGVTPDYDSYGHYAFDNAQAVVDYLNHQLPFTPDFVLHTGDVIYNPNNDAYPHAQAVLRQLRYPIYYVRGNHDDPIGMRQYLDNVPQGDGHLYYDFIMKDFHFVVLDSFGYTRTIGIIEDNQMTWLEATLRNSLAESLVITLHHPPLITGIPCYDERMILKNHNEFFEVLRPYRERIRGVFFGHIHRDTLALREGILCSSAASTWFQLYGWPQDTLDFRGDADALPGFKVVTLTHNQTWVTSHTIPKPTPPVR
jgi:3',5'-cyclic-AMP phosphodiesterase